MKNSQQLINNIIGQLKGVERMIEQNKDCLSLMVQLKAVRAAISSLMDKIAEQEFEYCLKKGETKEKANLKKIFKEIIKK